MQTEFFFVYGTLRRGCANFNRLASDALTIEPAETTGLLYHLPQGYPALFDVGQDIVYGESMAFPNPEATLQKIDQLEGFHPASPQCSHYLRIIKPVRIISTGVMVNAWAYIYPQDRLNWAKSYADSVPSGDWLDWVMGSILKQLVYLRGHETAGLP